MTTRLTDVVVPELWTTDFINQDPALVAFYNSGIVTLDAELDRLAKANVSGTFNVPFWNELSQTESNTGSDNPASSATPGKITTGTEKAIKQFRNQGWAYAQLTRALATSDPVRAIRSLVARYWVRQYQGFVINTLLGVLADNVANDSGDLLYDGTGDTPTTMNALKIIRGKRTMGDMASQLTHIAMHSIQVQSLEEAELIVYRRDSETGQEIATYQGLTVVEDDDMPVEEITPGTTYDYTSVVFGPGAVRMGRGAPAKPTAVEADEAAGDGEGIETLWTRTHFIMHPTGFAWQDASVAGNSPTNAELATAANWDRVYSDRKMIPFAFIKTRNG